MATERERNERIFILCFVGCWPSRVQISWALRVRDASSIKRTRSASACSIFVRSNYITFVRSRAARQRRRLIRYTMFVTRRSNVCHEEAALPVRMITVVMIIGITSRSRSSCQYWHAASFGAHLHIASLSSLNWFERAGANPPMQPFCETDEQKQPCWRVLIFRRTRRRQREGRSSMCNRRECQKFKLSFEVIK